MLEIKDVVTITTITFSATSLLISIFTFYWNILRKAEFAKTFITRIILSHWEGNGSNAMLSYIYLSVPIFNTGAKTAVVNTLYAELVNLLTKEKIAFYAFREGEISIENPDPPGQIIIPFSIKPNEGVVKSLAFIPYPVTVERLEYQEGLYEVSVFLILESTKPKRLIQQRIDIRLQHPSINSQNTWFLSGVVPFPEHVIPVSPPLV